MNESTFPATAGAPEIADIQRPFANGGNLISAWGWPGRANNVEASADWLHTADPFKMLDDQRAKTEELLHRSFAQTEQEISLATQNKLKTLETEYSIRRKALETKGADPQEIIDLNTRFEIATERVQGKIRPDLEGLYAERDQRLAILQQRFRDKMQSLSTIDALVQDGTIQDPVMAKWKKLQIAGVDVPINMLRQSKPQSLLQQTQDIDAYITDLTQALNSYKKGSWLSGLRYSPTGKKELRRGATEDEEKRFEFLLTELEKAKATKRQILADYWRGAGNEGAAKTIENSGRLSRAATSAVTGRPVSTLGREVARANERSRPTTAPRLSLPAENEPNTFARSATATAPASYDEFRKEVQRINLIQGRAAAERYYAQYAGRFQQ